MITISTISVPILRTSAEISLAKSTKILDVVHKNFAIEVIFSFDSNDRENEIFTFSVIPSYSGNTVDDKMIYIGLASSNQPAICNYGIDQNPNYLVFYERTSK